MPITLILIILPIITAFILFFIPKNYQKTIKFIAITTAFFTFIVTICMWFLLKNNNSFLQIESLMNFGMQQYIDIESFINAPFLYKIFFLGLDQLSLQFVLLTTLLTSICLLISYQTVNNKIKEYFICMLLLEGLIIGAFTAVDLFLFYIFFEASLVPIFILILSWGGEKKGFAALKLFLFTFFGSVLLLIAIIFIYKTFGSTNILIISDSLLLLDYNSKLYLCLAMLIAFAIKIPMWPFHTWLPDAHVQAPTTGSMMLAGVIIKLGAYAMIRFCLYLFPEIIMDLKSTVFILSIIGIIYASLVAMAQDNIKKMIAYSSVAHMGYVTIGIFSGSNAGLNGAIFQMISHGLISTGLFFAVGILYERFHTKQISEFGGIAEVMPKFALIFVFLTMSSIGLPGTSGFVGEFLVLTSLYPYNKLFIFFASLGIVLGAIYMLSLVKKVLYGKYTSKVNNVKDLTNFELIAFIPLIVLISILGIYPNIVTEKIEITVEIINKLMR